MLADVALERALTLPAAHGLIAFTGPPNSGKTEALVRRFAALLAVDGTLAAGAILTASRAAGAEALAARAALVTGLPLGGATLDALAFELLRAHPLESGLALDLAPIDPLDAEEVFERAAAPLFSADWSDFLGPDVDPEIAGLRTPDRFAVAALRLIRKLRDAGIDDQAFLATALRGATTFYAQPPNLAAPALLAATKDEHRASLAVDGSELDRQRKRELDLAKILARLYRAYVDELVRRGCLTPSDALVEAARLLEAHPAIARALRTRLRVAFVDDAQDLPPAALRFLRALFGNALDGVTVAGDPDLATQTFAGSRPERIFGIAKLTVPLHGGALPPGIAVAMRAVIDADPTKTLPAGHALRVLRAATREDEARDVAAGVGELIAAGTPPARIAVLHRTLRTMEVYEDGLVDRNIAIALAGDAALLARHETLDALALLWVTADPFKHAWTLRALQTPMIRLSDASLSLLCGEPSNPQPALFALPEGDLGGDRRWDRRRDLRLATNVIDGERDADLAAVTRDRLVAFRERRAAWVAWMSAARPAAASRAIMEDGGLFVARADETAARAARRFALMERLLVLIDAESQRHPEESLGEILATLEHLAQGECGPEIEDRREDAVFVGSVERALNRRFDHVFIVDARASAFPPYYVPDAFLFSPTYGMIPKDSAGDAPAARTAKFSWYEVTAKPRAAFVKEARRLFAAALGRADKTVTVTASGRPTRGVAAPEFAAEIQALLPR